MRRKTRILLVSMLIIGLFAAFAFAASDAKTGFYNIGTAEGVSIVPDNLNGDEVTELSGVKVDGTEVSSFFAGSDILKVTYDKAADGEEYLLVLVEGTELPSFAGLTKEQIADLSEVFYGIAQETAAGGSVSYKVVPKLFTGNKQFTLFITSSESGFSTISVPLYFGEYEDESSVLKGDVNGDGELNDDDAIHLLFYYFFGDEDYPVNQPCDFDGSGEVDDDDAIYLLFNYFFGDEDYPLF